MQNDLEIGEFETLNLMVVRAGGPGPAVTKALERMFLGCRDDGEKLTRIAFGGLNPSLIDTGARR